MRLIAPIVVVVVAVLCIASAQAQIPGDANCDGVVTLADEPALIFRIFNDINDCFGADVNGDGVVNAADLVALQPLLIPAFPTPTPLPGPQITFFGLATADGKALSSLGQIQPGVPVYYRPSGSGFKIVVEAAPGLSGSSLSFVVYNYDPNDPTQRPDLQIESTEPLGNGSAAVCDGNGVPAIDPPDFSVTQPISDALNDFACSFTTATSPGGACTQDSFGFTDFVTGASRGQYCLPVPATLRFPTTDTLLTVQLRDHGGNLSATASLIVRVSTGAAPSPFTPTPTVTPTSPRPSRTPTLTATATAVFTATQTPTATITPRPTATRTASPTRTATAAVSPSATMIGPSATPSRTFTRTLTRTATASPTVTSTPTRSATPTRSGTPTFTATPTVSPTVTSTPTPTPAIGPVITFFGLTTASDTVLAPTTYEGNIPVFEPIGLGFQIVVEAAPGPGGTMVGQYSFGGQPGISTCPELGNPLPDLEIEGDMPLGNGSLAVCDDVAPNLGGVPAVDPPSFANDPMIVNALNDFGCRFVNGSGNPVYRPCTSTDACVLFPSGNDGCVNSTSTAQFCARISSTLQFQPGDTLLVVRMLDCLGRSGEPAQLIVRVPTPS